jgi:hypothetical protein
MTPEAQSWYGGMSHSAVSYNAILLHLCSSGTLYVNADEVLLRIHLSQADGIFTFAATQPRTIGLLFEPVTVPFSFSENHARNIIK